ncbi:MAG: class I SAM-dependent methyltransferase [Myxococcota bacterium]
MKIADILQQLERIDRVVPLEGERYATCLATYEAASDQRQRILAWFAGDVVPGLSSERAAVLSVGCGAGELDRELLAAGAEAVSEVSYVGIEPDTNQCQRFAASMGFADDENVQVEAHNTSFEAFGEDRRFDVVLMVHSLYYMDDPCGAIAKALELVRDGGRLVILIASNDRLNELSSSFWKLTSAGATWFSEDLSDHLSELEVSFERKRIEATLDVTACCEPVSERGVRIADFLAQVSTGELPQPLRGMIYTYLDEASERVHEQRRLPHNVDAFTIDPAAPRSR